MDVIGQNMKNVFNYCDPNLYIYIDHLWNKNAPITIKTK